MLIRALDAALASASAAVVRDGAVLAERRFQAERGQAAALAPIVRDVLAEAGIAAKDLDAVAVTVGPGSFTGLRAALALGHGIAFAAACPVVGVTVAEALAAALPDTGKKIWCAIDSRRGRVFLDTGDGFSTVPLDALPLPDGAVAITGDAAEVVAALLVVRGGDATATDSTQPRAQDIARIAANRLGGQLPPLSAQPLYVDPPEAKLPAGGLRPAPVR
jgi:tRNA threonylcarbamoyladenosine biosynthesis protein TsaB